MRIVSFVSRASLSAAACGQTQAVQDRAAGPPGPASSMDAAAAGDAASEVTSGESSRHHTALQHCTEPLELELEQTELRTGRLGKCCPEHASLKFTAHLNLTPIAFQGGQLHTSAYIKCLLHDSKLSQALARRP